MSDFDKVTGFESTEETQNTPAVGVDTGKKKEVEILKQAAKELTVKIQSDPNYAAIRDSRCQDLRVLKILGYGDSGTLSNRTMEFIQRAVDDGTVKVLDADSADLGYVEEIDGTLHGTVRLAKGNGKDKYEYPYKKGETLQTPSGKPNTYRKVVNQPDNVGYLVENVSDKPIEYVTCVYSPNEAGEWVGQEIKKTIAPGKQVAIARAYLTRLALNEEFNLNLANGTIVCKMDGGDAKELLSKAYFIFDRKMGMDVNSPEVKILIHEEVMVNGSKTFKVRPEYEETFGYLNNQADKKSPRSRASKANDAIKPSSNEIKAHLLRQKLGM